MNSHYYLKAFNGKFVRVDNRDRLMASAANEQQGTQFQFEEIKEAKFALKQPDGRYVRVLPGAGGGGLVADAAAFTADSVFCLIHFGGNDVGLALRNMDHRDVDRHGPAQGECRCEFIGLRSYECGELTGHNKFCVTWEVFTLVPAAPPARPLRPCIRDEFDALAAQVNQFEERMRTAVDQFDGRFKSALENLRDSTPTELASLCNRQLAAIDAKLDQLAARERQAAEFVEQARRYSEQTQAAAEAIAGFLKHGKSLPTTPESRQPEGLKSQDQGHGQPATTGAAL